jgi:methylaspartate mutase sigma subunit
MSKAPTLVLGVIGADCHAVGNKILHHVFTNSGFNVVNLGVLVPQEEFVSAAVDNAADAMIVSSLYGHGEIDCRGLRERCAEAGIGKILIYVGGNLTVGKDDFDDVEKRFLKMGFDRAFRPGTLPEDAVAILKDDLRERGVEIDGK